jgi:hypothetical protein
MSIDLKHLIKTNAFRVDNVFDFFNSIITFNKYIEIRIFDLNKKYNPFSKYASNMNELLKIIKEFNNKNWLLYYGINTRPGMTRKNNDIVMRQIFYFDIEHSGDKPPITDEAYLNHLSDTVSFVSDYMRVKFKAEPCALVVSGRGVHLYYKHLPIDNVKYKKHFRLWFKSVQDDMEAMKPHKEIKFSDSVFDGSRIAAMPGTINFKYPEKVLRKILLLEPSKVFDLIPFLNMQDKKVKKEIEFKSKTFKNPAVKYNNDTIRESPEYKLLVNYNDLPEGQRHCHLIFALQLLCRDNNITILQDLSDELQGAGYDVDLVYPDEDYTYSTGIVNNWCLNNYDWCVDNNINLPFTFNYGIKRRFVKLSKMVDFPSTELNDFQSTLAYIREFNKMHMIEDYDSVKVLYDCLLGKLKECCNPKLFKFIEDNNLINTIITLR